MKTRREFVLDTSMSAMAVGLSSMTGAAEAKNQTGLVYDDVYLKHVLERIHVESPERLQRIMAVLGERGLTDELTRIQRMDDPMPWVEKQHTKAHVAAIRELPITGEVASAAVGGALAAVKAVSDGGVANAFCAVRPPGHHANNTGAEEGFCFYGNAAIAARYAQSLGHEKVLVIDWDYSTLR